MADHNVITATAADIMLPYSVHFMKQLDL